MCANNYLIQQGLQHVEADPSERGHEERKNRKNATVTIGHLADQLLRCEGVPRVEQRRSSGSDGDDLAEDLTPRINAPGVSIVGQTDRTATNMVASREIDSPRHRQAWPVSERACIGPEERGACWQRRAERRGEIGQRCRW